MRDKQDTFTGKQRFPILFKLAKACCVVPVSNADPERIFSMMKKIQTDMRSELHNDTVCFLVCAKQNQDVQCYLIILVLQCSWQPNCSLSVL